MKAFAAKCIKLFLIIIPIIPFSCSDSILELNKPHFMEMEVITFPDYQNQGVYLLDNRYLYQHILYRFDLMSEQWTAAGDGNGFPKKNRYSSLNIAEAFSVSPDSIIAFTHNGEVFSFDFTTKVWKLENTQAHRSTFFEGLSPYIYNSYNKKIYYFKGANSQTAPNYSAEIWVLEKNFSWKKLCSVSSDKIFPFDAAYFYDEDNIRIITHQEDIYSYYPTDSICIAQVNALSGKTFIDTSFELKRRSLSNLPNFHLLLINQQIYYYELVYNDYTKMSVSRIPLNNEMPFQTDTLSRKWEINNDNAGPWNDVNYLERDRIALYLFKNNYYLFVNDFVYKYSPQTKQWTALQPCPFKTLNKK